MAGLSAVTAFSGRIRILFFRHGTNVKNNRPHENSTNKATTQRSQALPGPQAYPEVKAPIDPLGDYETKHEEFSLARTSGMQRARRLRVERGRASESLETEVASGRIETEALRGAKISLGGVV